MTEILLDACWNRIGVHGDASCPQLAVHAHCRNCPVYADAAAELFNQPLFATSTQAPGLAVPLDERAWQPVSSSSGERVDATSMLVFRIGDEWLALPTTVFRQVAELRPIHVLPHRRGRAVLGVVNVRGALTVCVSLAELLGLSPSTSVAAADAGRRRPRLLVMAYRGEPAVFPVDEVDGVHRVAHAHYRALPSTVTHAAVAHTHALVPWRGATAGLLDPDTLFATLSRNLG